MFTIDTYRPSHPWRGVARSARRARLALQQGIGIRGMWHDQRAIAPVLLSRALVVHVGDIDVAFHPAGLLLFAAIAGACDIAVVPALFHGAPVLVSHLVAVAVALLLLATTLLHEAGHALAYCVQGGASIRIAVCGSGGVCTAALPHDSAGRALIRALAGPMTTVVGLAPVLVVYDFLPIPALWRTTVLVAASFAVAIEIANILPVHPRSDGTLALYALLWLICRREPDRFIALYVWRPLVLTTIATIGVTCAMGIGYVLPRSLGIGSTSTIIVTLYAIPLLTLTGRYLHSYRRHRNGSRQRD